jgi:hypothetical protein
MRRLTRPFRGISSSLILLLTSALVLSAAVPEGWTLAGSNPADYEAGTDADAVHNSHPSAYLRAKQREPEGWGTLMQDISATKYAAKRVRLNAFVKTKGVEGWAGLWLRIDKATGTAAFDNMQNRPIKGTGDWRSYDVVLDVPSDATGLFFGVLLSGPGTVWLNSVKVEVVGNDVPVTGKGAAPQKDEPANLNFDK